MLARKMLALSTDSPLWTCPRVAHLIEQEFDVNFSFVMMSRIRSSASSRSASAADHQIIGVVNDVCRKTLLVSEFAITKAMSGRFWLVWAGVRSDRRGEHENANEEQILNWKKNVWPELQKSAPGEAYPRLHRRKRTESAPASLSYLGTCGQTTILQYNFNRKTLSVAAGLTLWNGSWEGVSLFPAL